VGGTAVKVGEGVTGVTVGEGTEVGEAVAVGDAVTAGGDVGGLGIEPLVGEANSNLSILSSSVLI
jgi:hypothetical protein